MYIFKYHPDNTIYRNGEYISTFAEFMAENPNFPLIEGQFLEYGEGLDFINSEGHHFSQDLENHQTLINAITQE